MAEVARGDLRRVRVDLRRGGRRARAFGVPTVGGGNTVAQVAVDWVFTAGWALNFHTDVGGRSCVGNLGVGVAELHAVARGGLVRGDFGYGGCRYFTRLL